MLYNRTANFLWMSSFPLSPLPTYDTLITTKVEYHLPEEGGGGGEEEERMKEKEKEGRGQGGG